MKTNLNGTLLYFRSINMKPNYSELARYFGVDRHTIKNMYVGKEKKLRVKKPSELDKYKNDIEELLSHSGVRIKAAYWYIKNKYCIKCSYDNFKTYVRKHRLMDKISRSKPHPLYETAPGQQTQVDWVESLKLAGTNGDIFEFNLFSATLGYSRLHYFEYTEGKQETDFKRCLVHFFEKIGGTTKEVLTDNMSAIVNINEDKRIIHPSISHFFKDIGVTLKLCRVRSPQTKGKNETSNKYAQWLLSYDGKISNSKDIIDLVKKLNVDINNQVNTRTNYPPILLFGKEKEYLNPLPNKQILDSYEETMLSCKVSSSFLIEYKGSKYSVPPYLINKTVKYKEVNNFLYIYYNKNLVAQHAISARKKSINYRDIDYKNSLTYYFKNEDDIDRITKENLAKLKDIGEK